MSEKNTSKQLYIQALSFKTSKILKIKENFPNLSVNKINNIHKMIHSNGKSKPKLNMTTKSLSRKQVIVPMSNDNKAKFMASLSKYITNINRSLKNIKSEVMTNFVYINLNSIIIITNKVALALYLQTMEKYIKNIDHIKSEKIDTLQLPQSKSYFKIINIPYLIENTNMPILSDIVETIIKKNYIFNNIAITSKSCIIKVLPKSDMTIIWLNI